MKYTALVCAGLMAVAGYAQSENPLTLEQALALARSRSPALLAGSLNVRAADRAVGAVGLRSNPGIEFEAEGIGGNLDPYDEAEYTLSLYQEFLRGGKRAADRQAALHSVGIARHGAAEQEIALSAEVREAFLEMQARQEIGRVRADQLELGRAFVEVARRRLDAGAGSRLEVVQAELALEEIVLAQTCCYGDLAAARARLSSLLGLPAEQLPELTGPYYVTGTTEQYTVDDHHPTLLRLEAEAERMVVLSERARAQDAGNLKLGVGYRYEAADDINTFVFSASMPLIFSRQGRIEQAAGLLRADALRLEREEAGRRLRQELDILRELHNGAVMEVTLTRDRILPKAEEAYAISLEGYGAGRFSWLELISAQQHLAEVRIRHIEALLAVHRIEVELAKFRKRTP